MDTMRCWICMLDPWYLLPHASTLLHVVPASTYPPLFLPTFCWRNGTAKRDQKGAPSAAACRRPPPVADGQKRVYGPLFKRRTRRQFLHNQLHTYNNDRKRRWILAGLPILFNFLAFSTSGLFILILGPLLGLSEPKSWPVPPSVDISHH